MQVTLCILLCHEIMWTFITQLRFVVVAFGHSQQKQQTDERLLKPNLPGHSPDLKPAGASGQIWELRSVVTNHSTPQMERLRSFFSACIHCSKTLLTQEKTATLVFNYPFQFQLWFICSFKMNKLSHLLSQI